MTPRGARGKPTGEPTYKVHICAGINGIAQLPNADPALVELGFLAAGYTRLFLERALVLFKEIRSDAAFKRLRDDEARTRLLREQLGPRLVAEPAIRSAVCETVERFRGETGIDIRECARERPGSANAK